MNLFELLFLVIPISLGAGVGTFAANFFGVPVGIVVGILTTMLFFYCLKILSVVSHRRHCRTMEKKYTRIFRVLVLPANEVIAIKTKNSEIKLGDYGWECSPIASQKNGLVYLQSFNEKWQLIWWAGFQPEQIEFVSPKPFSQYDRFLPDKQEILKAPCPFPVQPRTNTFAS